jgi:hypothetical protein
MFAYFGLSILVELIIAVYCESKKQLRETAEQQNYENRSLCAFSFADHRTELSASGRLVWFDNGYSCCCVDTAKSSMMLTIIWNRFSFPVITVHPLYRETGLKVKLADASVVSQA